MDVPEIIYFYDVRFYLKRCAYFEIFDSTIFTGMQQRGKISSQTPQVFGVSNGTHPICVPRAN